MKGQTSFELLLVAIIITSVAMVAFQVYSEQSSLTTANAVVRSEADKIISTGALDHPECAHVKLLRIDTDYDVFTIVTNDAECTEILFKGRTTEIQEKISYALGCNPRTEGACKGFLFTVEI